MSNAIQSTCSFDDVSTPILSNVHSMGALIGLLHLQYGAVSEAELAKNIDEDRGGQQNRILNWGAKKSLPSLSTSSCPGRAAARIASINILRRIAVIVISMPWT